MGTYFLGSDGRFFAGDEPTLSDLQFPATGRRVPPPLLVLIALWSQGRLDDVDRHRVHVTVERHVVQIADLIRGQRVVRYGLGDERRVVDAVRRRHRQRIVRAGEPRRAQ